MTYFYQYIHSPFTSIPSGNITYNYNGGTSGYSRCMFNSVRNKRAGSLHESDSLYRTEINWLYIYSLCHNCIYFLLWMSMSNQTRKSCLWIGLESSWAIMLNAHAWNEWTSAIHKGFDLTACFLVCTFIYWSCQRPLFKHSIRVKNDLNRKQYLLLLNWKHVILVLTDWLMFSSLLLMYYYRVRRCGDDNQIQGFLSLHNLLIRRYVGDRKEMRGELFMRKLNPGSQDGDISLTTSHVRRQF